MTHKVRGSGAPTKIRTACCVSASRKAQTCHATHRQTFGHDRVAIESTSVEDIGISDASGYIGGRCCSHRMSLPPCTLPRNRHELLVWLEASGPTPTHSTVPGRRRESERLLCVAPPTKQCPSAGHQAVACPHAAAPSTDEGTVWRGQALARVASYRGTVQSSSGGPTSAPVQSHCTRWVRTGFLD